MEAWRHNLAALLHIIGLGMVVSFHIATKGGTFTKKLGDSLTLECFIEGDDYNVMESPGEFYKDGVRMNSNARVVEPFSTTQRYKVNIAGDKFNEYSLTIKDITAAENGQYECRVPGVHKLVHHVIVAEPIEYVRLTSENMQIAETDPPQKTLHFVPGETPSFKCEVKGGRPEPTVTMHRTEAGGEPIDITSQFDILSAPIENSAEGEGLKYNLTQVSVTPKSFTVMTDYNGQSLQCKAKVPIKKNIVEELGLQDTKKTDTAKMEIQYAPVFDGCKKEVEATVGQRLLQLECTVKANPKIKMDNILWSFSQEDNKTEIKHGVEYERDTFETRATEDDNGYVTVVFEIKHVNSSDFTLYTLQVENDIGSGSHQFEVVHKSKKVVTLPPEPNPGEVNDKQNPESAGCKTVATLIAVTISILLPTIL